MAGTKISNLAEVTDYSSSVISSTAPDDEIPLSRAGTNYKIKARNLRKFGNTTPIVGDVPRYVSGSTKDYVPTNPRWRILTPGTDYVPTLPTRIITAATNATPIVITAADHKLSSGEHVTITGCTGNTAANGTFEVDANTVRIIGATNATPIVLTTIENHNFQVNDEVRVEGVEENTNSAANSTNANPSWTVSAVTANTLTLADSVGNGDYDTDDSGGWVSWADKFKLKELDNSTRIDIAAISQAGSGATVSITATSGVITAVTATPPAGGTGYPQSATFALKVAQGSAVTGYVTATTNASGVITSYATTPAYGGSGYTTATGVATGSGAEIRLTTGSAHGITDFNRVIVVGVEGTVEANNSTSNDWWLVHQTTSTTMELVGSAFVNAWTLGGTVEAAWANRLIDVEGNGTYVANSGSMIRPGRITIYTSGSTDDQLMDSAEALGFYPGLPLRMKTSAGTTYGIIGTIPGRTGWPPRVGLANVPTNLSGELTVCGPLLTSNLTELAIGNPEMIKVVDFNCNIFPYYGSKVHLPISQLIQGSGATATMQDKWRAGIGGSTTYSTFGRSSKHWDFPKAYLVTFLAGHSVRAVEGNASNFFSGGTMSVAADISRPYNVFEQHTDGWAGQGSLVTRDSSSFHYGDAITGLRGWTFRKMDVTDPSRHRVIESSVIREGGYGSDLLYRIVGATNASPIVITTELNHGLTTGCKVTICSVTGNTAANVTSNRITKLSATTFSLDGTTGNGTYGGIQQPVTITDVTNATPPVVTTLTAHGYANNDEVVIFGVLGNTAANGLHKIGSVTATTFTIGGPSGPATQPRVGNGGYAGGGTVTKGGGFFRNGLTAAQFVLESMTMSAASNSSYQLHDLARQPIINVDVGGQLLSTNDGYRGLQLCPTAERTIFYNQAAEINRNVYDLPPTHRFEICCTSIGNKPGVSPTTNKTAATAAYQNEEGLGGAEYLKVIMTFVLE